MRLVRPALVALVAVVFAFAAGGARRPARGGSVRLPTASPVASLDPVAASSPDEVLLAGLLHDSPYRLGPDRRPAPHLLSAPAVAADGRTCRLRVAPHVVFHDGTPLRAEHVAASLARLASSRSSGWLLAMVESASAIRAPTADEVEIRLSTPHGIELLAFALAAPQAGVVRSAASAGRGLGTGPFELRRRVGGGWLLGANRDYFDGPPFLDEATFLGPAERDDHIRRFQLGRAEGSLLGDSVYGERAVGRVDQTEGPAVLLTALVLNASRGAMRDERLRRAVELALERERLAGDAARPAGLPGAAGAPRSDANAARREVAAASGGGPGTRPLVLLVDGHDPFGEALASLLVRDLAAVGLTADRVVASGATARARLTSGTWDLRLVTLPPPSPDEALQLGQLLALGGQTAEAARLLRRAGDDRRGEVARARAALVEARTVLPLVRRAPRLYHRPGLRAAAFDGLGRLLVPDLWLRPGEPAGEEP